MTPSAKAQNSTPPANAAPQKPATANGVITEPLAPAVNRKKAKRRAKERARRDAVATQRATDEYGSDELDDTDLAPPGSYPTAQEHDTQPSLQYNPRYPNDVGQYQDPNGSYVYSDEDGQYAYDPGYADANGVYSNTADDMAQGRKGRKKKKKSDSTQYDPAYQQPPPTSYYNAPPPRPRITPTITEDALRTVEQKVNDDIWETSSREERDRIRQFWLKLPEKERGNLVRIEKDAVLRKMKEQQKHSCSCTVCGRKRTAIEEELEQLYDAYYAELEQYADGDRPAPSPIASYGNVSTPNTLRNFAHPKLPSRGRIQELPDDEEEDDLDDPDDEYDDEEDALAAERYNAEYARDHQYLEAAYGARKDFFTFGRNLTVKGGILTVADDLLSNHGEKFIDMMEQLATARMRRENEAYASYSNQQHLHGPHPGHYPEDEDYDDEDEYDEEDSLGDEYEEEDDEMDQMTNEQRMDEGRRMFQIFAARMFEQRVLGAYREDVSKKKAEQLIAEEEAEKHGDAAREAKKAREAEKKKQKKQAKKSEKAEKEQKKEAERQEAERQAQETEAKRQEEQRVKREEQKKKREAEKKAQDEERRRKEEEKRRHQEELKAKQQEKERQARDAKAVDKRKKEEERKRQQEEKEAKATAARERKAQQEREESERQEKAKADAEAAERKRKDEEAQRMAAEHARRPLPPAVALPPSLKHQKSGTGSQSSPQVKVATPAIPKATTPQQRQPSAAVSQRSSSQEPDAPHSSKQSTPPTQPTPTSAYPPSNGSARAPSRQTQPPFAGQMSSSHAMAPPPGMPFPPQSHYPGGPAQSMNGYPPGMGMPGMHQAFNVGRGGFPMGPQMNMPIRPNPQQQAHFGYNAGPSMPAHGARTGASFGHDGPSPTSAFNGSKSYGQSAPRTTAPGPPGIGGHSRQPSASFEGSSPADSNLSQQPIGRPAPIKRPESTKPEREHRTQSMPQSNNDDGDAYLGSSALLGDSEPQDSVERRQTAPHLPAVTTSGLTTPGLSTPGLGTPGFSAFGSHPQPFARSDAGYTSPLTATSSGWSGGWGGPSGLAGPAPQRHAVPRLVMLRRLAVDALSSTTQDDVEVNQLLSYVNAHKPASEAPLRMPDLQMILETEGDSQNGGRNFDIKPTGNTVKVSLQRDSRTTGGARGNAIGAEIGSPLPNSGRPF